MLREGGDVTIVAILRMVDVAEKAAKTLANEHGAEAEVIDPRTLRPLDLDTILDSVRKTNRCVIVEEGWPHGGVGANLAALIQEQAFDHLDAPIQRVTGADVPMPYARRLEQAAIPHPEHVVSAALATLEGASVVATDIVMPRLSDSMEEGTILRWLKSPGDEVSVGEELVEIETDKANMVYEAPDAGTLVEIVAQEGDTLPIGQVIARVGEAGEKPSATRRRPGGRWRGAPNAKPPPRRRPNPLPPPAKRLLARLPSAPRKLRQAEDGRAKASPLARRIAKENGLQLAAIAGSGPGGRIVKADVERAIAAGPAAGRSRGAGRRAAAGRARRGDSGGARAARDRQGSCHPGGADEAPADRRPADGRVEGHRAALLPVRRGGHEPRGRGARANQGGRRRRQTSCRHSTTWW